MNGNPKWRMLCDMLGVEPEEEFRIEIEGRKSDPRTKYKVTVIDGISTLLVQYDRYNKWEPAVILLNSLFDKDTKIIHEAYVPRDNDWFYSIIFKQDDYEEYELHIERDQFYHGYTFDMVKLAMGNCFRSEQEIYDKYGSLGAAFEAIYGMTWDEFKSLVKKTTG